MSSLVCFLRFHTQRAPYFRPFAPALTLPVTTVSTHAHFVCHVSARNPRACACGAARSPAASAAHHRPSPRALAGTTSIMSTAQKVAGNVDSAAAKTKDVAGVS